MVRPLKIGVQLPEVGYDYNRAHLQETAKTVENDGCVGSARRGRT